MLYNIHTLSGKGLNVLSEVDIEAFSLFKFQTNEPQCTDSIPVYKRRNRVFES